MESHRQPGRCGYLGESRGRAEQGCRERGREGLAGRSCRAFQSRHLEARGRGEPVRQRLRNGSVLLNGRFSQAASNSVLRLESSFFPSASGSHVGLCIRITHRPVKTDCWPRLQGFCCRCMGSRDSTLGPSSHQPLLLHGTCPGNPCCSVAANARVLPGTALSSSQHTPTNRGTAGSPPGARDCTPSIPC